METKSGGSKTPSLDYWRDYFRRANSDIFDVIEYAITVAASDCPKEFRLKRGVIAELLFSCRLTRSFSCGRVELAASQVDDVEEDEEEDEDENENEIEIEGSKIKESEFVHVGGGMESMNQYNPESNFSYGDAVEALTDEIEEQGEILGEVLRIKEILQNSKDESESVLFESLRRLQLMALNVDILKETGIGKAVNGIRRHGSKQIRHLACKLIEGWKMIVEEWVKTTQEIAERGTPDSVNPSTVEEEGEDGGDDEEEEEGLPSPPLDEGAFFATQNMELSKFFDGMDDYGNPRSSGEFNKNQGIERKPCSLVKKDAPKPRDATPLFKDNKADQIKRKVPVPKPNKPSNTQSGPGRPVKPNEDPKILKDPKIQHKLQKPMVQRRPTSQAETVRFSDEDAVQEKLEATKRKLQERYQQAENAKRQKTIQVMELQDLPKRGVVSKNAPGRFGNYNRKWGNARR